MEVDEILNNDGRCEDIFGDAGGEELDNANAWTDQDREMVAPVKGLVKTAVKLLKKAKEASSARFVGELGGELREAGWKHG